MKIRMSELIELMDHFYERKIMSMEDKIRELQAKIDYMADIIANIGEKDE